MKEREEDIFDLKSRLNDAENFKINNQMLHTALIHDLKKTICVCFIKILLFIAFLNSILLSTPLKSLTLNVQIRP